MPTPGLSLVGFIPDQARAVHHLKTACVPNPTNKPDAALAVDWAAAQAQLGAPIANAGQPQLQIIPITDPYIQQLLASPIGAGLVPMLTTGATFQMVEIAPLLAWQFAVDTPRAGAHCAPGTTPTPAEVMQITLPQNASLAGDDVHFSPQPNSMILKSRSLNFDLLGYGQPPGIDFIGAQIGWRLPFVQVVRFGGRCYLYNGYHRAYGLSAAGVASMPCLFRDVASAADAGIRPNETIDEAVLASANPPTIAHFTQGRAYPVQLRRTMRIISISWSNHVIVDE